MNIWDYLILAALAAAVVLALIKIIGSRKRGKTCCGDCSRCRGGAGCGEAGQNKTDKRPM